MHPVQGFFILLAIVLHFFILWVIIRTAVTWGVLTAASKMRENGRTLPVSIAAPQDAPSELRP